MIVVEGPDGAGKTTLITTLVEALGVPVAPRVVSKDTEAMVDLKVWVEDNVAGGFQKKIFDRHRLISEPIYGPILRNKFEPGFDDPEWFDPILYAFYSTRPVVIYCLPPFEVVYNNVKDDPDNVKVRDNIRAIWGSYFNRAYTEKALWNSWVYDYTSPIASDIQKLIIHNCKTRLHRAR